MTEQSISSFSVTVATRARPLSTLCSAADAFPSSCVLARRELGDPFGDASVEARVWPPARSR